MQGTFKWSKQWMRRWSLWRTVHPPLSSTLRRGLQTSGRSSLQWRNPRTEFILGASPLISPGRWCDCSPEVKVREGNSQRRPVRARCSAAVSKGTAGGWGAEADCGARTRLLHLAHGLWERWEASCRNSLPRDSSKSDLSRPGSYSGYRRTSDLQWGMMETAQNWAEAAAMHSCLVPHYTVQFSLCAQL